MLYSLTTNCWRYALQKRPWAAQPSSTLPAGRLVTVQRFGHILTDGHPSGPDAQLEKTPVRLFYHH